MTQVKITVTGLKQLPYGENLKGYIAEAQAKMLPLVQAHWAATVDAFLFELYFSSHMNSFSKHNFSGAMAAYYASLYKSVYAAWPTVEAVPKLHKGEVTRLPSSLIKDRKGIRGGIPKWVHWWPKSFGSPINLKKVWFSQAIPELYQAGKSQSRLNFSQVTFSQGGEFNMPALMPEHKLGIKGQAGSHNDKEFGRYDEPLSVARRYWRNNIPRQQFKEALTGPLANLKTTKITIT